jgi:hypothetical protein
MSNSLVNNISELVKKLGKPSMSSIVNDLKTTAQENQRMGSKISGTNYLYDAVPASFNGSLVTVVRKAGSAASEYEVQIVSMGASILYMPEVARGDNRYMRQYDLSSKNDIDAYIGGILKKFKTDGGGNVEVVYYKYDAPSQGDTFHAAYHASVGAALLMQRRPSNAETMRVGPLTHYVMPGSQPQAQDDLAELLGLTDAPAKKSVSAASNPEDYVAGRGDESPMDAVKEAKVAPHRKRNLQTRAPEAYIKALVRSKG